MINKKRLFLFILTVLSLSFFTLGSFKIVNALDEIVDVESMEISSVEDFLTFSNYVNGGGKTEGVTFTLTNDIIFNSGTFDSLGEYTPSDSETLTYYNPIGQENSFKGIFDGNNRKIVGLFVNTTYTTDNVGLFAKAENAIIKNLKITNSFLKGASSTSYVGAVVGYNYLSTFQNVLIENSYINDVFISTSEDSNYTTLNNTLLTGPEVIGVGERESWVIKTVEDFLNFADDVNSGENTEGVTVYLENDLSFNPGDFDIDGNYIPYENEELYVYTPICFEYPFKGIFEGNERTISGIYTESQDYVGLFAKTEFATIRDLKLSFSYMKGGVNADYVGGIVGYAYGTSIESVKIEHSFVKDVFITNSENEENYEAINESILVGAFINEVEISTIQDLIDLSSYVSSGAKTQNLSYILTQDIVLSDTIFSLNGDYTALNSFVPIGNAEHAFKGSFDGHNHKISGLYIDKTKLDTQNIDTQYLGLFGRTEGATLKNLVIENSYIKGEENIALLCGYAKNTIVENVSVNKCFVDGKSNLGGILSTLNAIDKKAEIKNCYFYGTIKGRDNIGGILAQSLASTYFNSVKVDNVYAYGNIISLGSKREGVVYSRNIGGVVGYSSSADITNCKNYINFSIVQTDITLGEKPEINYLGGICSYSQESVLSNCENNSNLESGTNYVGGICAESSNSTIKNCVNKGNIIGKSRIGGICGSSNQDESLIDNSVNYGNVSGIRYVGGIAGECTNVSNSKSYGNIYSRQTVSYTNKDASEYEIEVTQLDQSARFFGGICGYHLENGTINYSSFAGTISLELLAYKARYVGGLVGYGTKDNIINSFASGQIKAYGDYIGGLVGSFAYLESDDDSMLMIKETGKLGNSYSKILIEKINDIAYCGGLVGYSKDSTINNCFTLKNIDATSNFGALIGYQENSTITDCYYPNNILIGAINGLDDTQNNCYSINYSEFKTDDQNSLVMKLNENINSENGYNYWCKGNEHPEYLFKYSTLTYNLNMGAGVVVDNKIYDFGASTKIDFSHIPTRQNYTFVGYILNDDDSVIYTLENDEIVLANEQNTLLAVWTENYITGIFAENIESGYTEGLNMSILVSGTTANDTILFSEDGINFEEENFEYSMPGVYKVFYKVQRENYFDYNSFATITINKLDLNLNDISWQREWYILSLEDDQIETLRNNTFVYNSYENKISIIPSSLPSGVTVKYEINGEEVSFLTCKNSGFYSITAIISYDKTIYNHVDNIVTLNVEVTKKSVSVPYILGETSFEFNNSNITLGITNEVSTDTSTYLVTNDTNKFVGEYTATCSLKDVDNFVWENGNNLPIKFDYTITKKIIERPVANKTSFVYDGLKHKLTFDSSSDLWAVMNNKEQTNVGKYEVIIYLTDTKNYAFSNNSIVSISYEMEITLKEIAIPTIARKTFTYDGTSKSINVLETDDYLAINTSNVVAGQYKAIIALKDKLNTVWKLQNNNQDIVVDYVIYPKQISINMTTETYTYNKTEQTFKIVPSLNYAIYNNKRTDAGSQTVIVTLIDKANTCWTDETTEDKTFDFVILNATMSRITEGIEPSLVEDEVVTNINSLALTGAKVEYSLSRDGTYTDKISLTEDGTYTVFYKISLENYNDLIGSFKITRQLDNIDDDNDGSPIFVIVLLITLLLIGGFVWYCYSKKILIFKPKTTDLNETIKDKRLVFEVNESANKEVTSKSQKTPVNKNKNKSNKEKLLEHLSEDLEKAKENKVTFEENLTKDSKIEETNDLQNEEEKEILPKEENETIEETKKELKEETKKVEIKQEKENTDDLISNIGENQNSSSSEENEESNQTNNAKESIFDKLKFGNKNKKVTPEVKTYENISVKPTFDDDDEI